MDHLSLVFFTVLAQASIGLFIVLGILHFTVKPTNNTLSKGFLFVWPLFGVAILFSLTHLGQPLRAFNVLTGLAHGSPLSIEIASSIIFGGFGFVYTVLQWFKLGSELLRKSLLIVTMMIGLWLLLAISNVYTLEGVVAWSSLLTPLQFFSTGLLLGVASAIVIIHVIQSKSTDQSDMVCRSIQMSTTTLLGIGILASMSVFAAFLVHVGRSGDITHNLDSYIVMARVISALIGATLCLAYVIKPASHHKLTITLSMSFGLLLLLTSELSARVIFYDMYHASGM